MKERNEKRGYYARHYGAQQNHKRRHSDHAYDDQWQRPDSWSERRRQGFGMNLYRNKEKGKLAGVCAGLADHFNVDAWIVRLAAIGGFFFFNSLMVFAYIAAWICLAKRPSNATGKTRYRYDETIHQDRPVNMFRYETSPSERLATARSRLDSVLQRVGTMERYVTSKRFELDKEFSKMEK